MATGEELIPRASVEALCMAWQDSRAQVERAFLEMQAADERIRRVWGELGGADRDRLTSVQFAAIDRGRLDDCILDAKRRAWSRLVDHCGFRALMSVRQQSELDSQLWGGGTRYHPSKSDELPDLTPETVYGWLAKLSEGLGDMFREACVEVFKMLTPQSGWHDKYKTNEANRRVVGEKLILTWMVERNHNRGLRVRYGREPNLMALGNVFSLLDGKGPQQRPNDLVTQLHAHWRQSQEPYEDAYFQIKGFPGTGTMHIKLKRPDLVKALNERAAGMNLDMQAAAEALTSPRRPAGETVPSIPKPDGNGADEGRSAIGQKGRE